MFHHSDFILRTACFELKLTMYSNLSAWLTGGFVLPEIQYGFDLQASIIKSGKSKAQ